MYYLNVAEVFKDENGYLKLEYCSDRNSMGMHFTYDGAKGVGQLSEDPHSRGSSVTVGKEIAHETTGSPVSHLSIPTVPDPGRLRPESNRYAPR